MVVLIFTVTEVLNVFYPIAKRLNSTVSTNA